ncbi:MAG: hypothetical protein G01um101466_587 [Parcubacteria group bacterium Gr01-1014_66]|nr:MAG: hypothetical protein G01um101466_587 [Parcubacteria group bacterium Gr01-1014_66]
MTYNIINLKKEAKEIPDGIVPDPESSDIDQSEREGGIHWHIQETQLTRRGKNWFFAVTISTAILALIALLTKSALFFVLIALAYAVIFLDRSRTPQQHLCIVHETGVQIGPRFYAPKDLIAFSIAAIPELTRQRHKLVLHTTHYLHPSLYIPLQGVDHEEIRGVLGTYLPEKHHQETLFEQLVRLIGF